MAIVAVILVFMIALGVATTVYVGSHAKKNVDEIKQEVIGQAKKETDAISRMDSGGSDPSSPQAKQDEEADGHSGLGVLNKILGDSPPMPMYADDIPGSFIVGNTPTPACPEYSGSVPTSLPLEKVDPARIPLRGGLVIVTAWRRFNGDVEGILRVDSVDNNKVAFSDSSTGFSSDTAVEGTKVDASRTICRADLVRAEAYMTENEADFPNIFLGTTAFTIPTQLFQQLKSSGKIKWNYVEYYKLGAPQRFVPYPWAGELTRVESGDVPFPVILNDQFVQAPTIHAKGILEFTGADKVGKTVPAKYLNHQETDVYIIDNPENPICLLYQQGPVFQIKIVKITVPLDKPVSQIEQQLKEQKKATVYGIYFDFDKDTIKPESEAVLKEISAAMTDNPDWRLKVEGHTDNIGSDAHNLDLSKRRAASVKQALVDRYHISADRLATGGFGASRPVDRNDTLEGRARNRRVELSRE